MTEKDASSLIGYYRHDPLMHYKNFHNFTSIDSGFTMGNDILQGIFHVKSNLSLHSVPRFKFIKYVFPTNRFVVILQALKVCIL